MCQLVISRQCTSKHDLCVALKVPLSGCCRPTAALPCLWAASEASCLPVGHWLLCMSGSECAIEERNLHGLMRPSSVLLVFITQQCVSVCEWVKEWGKKKLHVSGCVRLVGCERVQLWGGFFDSCYILWQRCHRALRCVHTMRLTQRCSPQPQFLLIFPKNWWHEFSSPPVIAH